MLLVLKQITPRRVYILRGQFGKPSFWSPRQIAKGEITQPATSAMLSFLTAEGRGRAAGLKRPNAAESRRCSPAGRSARAGGLRPPPGGCQATRRRTQRRRRYPYTLLHGSPDCIRGHPGAPARGSARLRAPSTGASGGTGKEGVSSPTPEGKPGRKGAAAKPEPRVRLGKQRGRESSRSRGSARS